MWGRYCWYDSAAWYGMSGLKIRDTLLFLGRKKKTTAAATGVSVALVSPWQLFNLPNLY